MPIDQQFSGDFEERIVSSMILDSKNTNFELYEEFLNSQTRYSMLKVVNGEKAEKLLIENKDNAKRTYSYYESLQNK